MTGRHRSVLSGFALVAVVVLGSAAGWYVLQAGRYSPAAIAPAALGMPTGPGIAVLRFKNPAGDSTSKARSRRRSPPSSPAFPSCA